MTHLLKQALFSVCLLTGAALATSCSNNKDLFDQDEWNKMMEESFPVSNIQTSWQTIGTATANVTVNEDAGETYTVKLYDSDPLVSTSTAVLLAKGTVTSGSTYSSKFDYALADSVIYVACVDSKNRREVIPVHNVTNGSSFSITFGSSSSSSSSVAALSRSVSSRASVSITDPAVAAKIDCPYTESDVKTMLSKAIEVSSLGSGAVNIAPWVTNNKTLFKITDTFSGDIKDDAPATGTTIIITGTWTPTYTSFQDGLQVIVAKGGKLVLNYGMSSNRTSGYGFVVMPGGEISGSGSLNYSNPTPKFYNGGTIKLSSMTSSSGGTYYNAGTLTLSDLALNTGTNLINYGTTNVSGKISSPSGGYVINGSGATMYAQSLELKTQATLINHSKNCHFGNATSDYDNGNFETDCKLVIDGDLTPSHLVIGDNASVECSTLYLHNSGIVEIGNASILKATTSYYQGFKMNGPTSGNPAIFVAGNIAGGYDVASFNNLLYVDVTSHPSSTNPWDWYNTVSYNNGASSVGNGEAKETIPSGDCSIGYTSKESPTPVVDTNLATTYCFEDNYPNAGDYDFNDAVFDISKSIDKKVVTLNVKLRAVGASLKLAGAIRLNGIESKDIVSVTSDNGFGLGAISSYQNGNGGIVIPLFDDAHKALSGSTERKFLNTEKSGTTVDTKTLVITITCQSTSAATSIDFSTIDPYIDNGSYEIHTYPWSNNAALGKVATALESGKYVWAIAVPSTSAGSFKYPYEYQVITGAYPDFATWAGSTDNTAWYSTYDSTKVHN